MLTLFNSETAQKRGQIGQSCPKDIVPFLAVFYYQTSCPIFGRTQSMSVVLAPLRPGRPTAYPTPCRIEHATFFVEHTMRSSLAFSERF